MTTRKASFGPRSARLAPIIAAFKPGSPRSADRPTPGGLSSPRSDQPPTPASDSHHIRSGVTDWSPDVVPSPIETDMGKSLKLGLTPGISAGRSSELRR